MGSFMTLILVLIGMAFTSAAQTSAGALVGLVRDPAGAAVPGASVTATNTQTNVSFKIQTDDTGNYFVPSLMPGTYSVVCEHTGFKRTTVGPVTVNVNQTLRVDLNLQVGETAESVTVQEFANLVQTDNATIGQVVTTRQLAELPLNGRDFRSLLRLNPGVTEPQGGISVTASIRRQGFNDGIKNVSINGARPSSVTYLIDGVALNEPLFQFPSQIPPIEAVEEFKLQNALYPAEFGMGVGQVSIAMKAGTNQVHGSLFDFLRNDALQKYHPRFRTKTPLKQNQFGGVVGGPVSLIMRGAVLLILLVAAVPAQERLPLGKLPPGRVLLVAQPHHDDHTTDYGMGGLIARFIESGFEGYYVRGSNDEKDGAHGYGRNDIINLKETWDAIRILGMKKVISLNWRNDFMNPIPLDELREQLIFLIRKYRPDVVLGHNPWEHYQKNPDHRNVARALVEACWLAGYETVHPEHLDLGLKPHAVSHYYGKARLDWGRGQVSNIAMELNESQERKKELAIAAHRNVYGSGGAARALSAQLWKEGKYMPEFEKAANELEASDMITHWWMNWTSREIGRKASVKYAEDYYYTDELYHLPGLREFVAKNAESVQ